MWVLTVFDLPVLSKKQRQSYSKYRKTLLESGFLQLQYSVYIKCVGTHKQALQLVSRIGAYTPENGKTSFFFITDKQYGITKNFYGPFKAQEALPKKQEQGLFFFMDES